VGSPASLYGTLLLSGFLGSLGHCLGMCGPLVMMVALRLGRRGTAALLPLLSYHLARVTVYAVLGAAVGSLGSLLGVGSRLSSVAGLASVVLGLGVVLFGLGYLGWLPVGRLEGAGTWFSRATSDALRRGGTAAPLLLGALNGLLPCGLVYSALLLAAAAGGPLPAALAMVAFGLGTIPALLVVGIGARALSARARQTLLRVAGVFIVVVGLQLALRGLAALRIAPHLRLGGLVLW
jgi:sulfite exporter TauE/SafE